MLGTCDPAHGGRKNTKAAIGPHNCVKKTKFGPLLLSCCYNKEFWNVFFECAINVLTQIFHRTCCSYRRATVRAHGVVGRKNVTKTQLN